MKLLYCERCDDMVKLTSERRECRCGACAGRYEADGITATVSGPAVMVGIQNGSFSAAIRNAKADQTGTTAVLAHTVCVVRHATNWRRGPQRSAPAERSEP